MNRINTSLHSINDKKLRFLLSSTCRAALVGGNILKNLHNQPHTITRKGQTDLVTEADIAAEEAIILSLNNDTPDIAILAEESGILKKNTIDDTIWIVDPLDGTTNFAHGFPFFCTSIGLLKNNKPIAGAIYAPMFDELFYGCAGHGAWLNGTSISVTPTEKLIESLVATGFPYETELFIKDIINRMTKILPKVRDIRRAGAAALDLAYVACGRLDGFYEADLKPWDTAAGWLLVQEAGGRVSTFKDIPFSPFIPEIIATNGKIHNKLFQLIS